jgi:hypothetical protein
MPPASSTMSSHSALICVATSRHHIAPTTACEPDTCGLRVRDGGVHRVRLGLLPAVMSRHRPRTSPVSTQYRRNSGLDTGGEIVLALQVGRARSQSNPRKRRLAYLRRQLGLSLGRGAVPPVGIRESMTWHGADDPNYSFVIMGGPNHELGERHGERIGRSTP